VPVVVSLLIALSGLRNSDPCYFKDIIPDYLFFHSPDFENLEGYITNGVRKLLIAETDIHTDDNY
jgi:hypothetical protein